ncbi:hypothetical protein JL720_8038 [Aureococcus anophagefferens]|nr:hypothetical protein JL720_8038 [Aureococcus anophagefferens]
MASSPAASSQRRSIPAVVHTRIDKARVRTLAQNIASTHLSALLGSGVALPKPPALPWVDLEVSPRFDRPVEICIDCPEKACGAPGVARVLVLLEPEEVSRAAAAAAARGGFDVVLGHDAAATAAAGARAAAFFAHGGTWVPEATWRRPRSAPKRRAASLVCGDKRTTRGHAIRRALWAAAAGSKAVARFASARATTLAMDGGAKRMGAAPEAKAAAVAPYAFHVAIENVRRDGYFTEKLLDCFLLRTVPIYWGCPNLADFGFDATGVIVVDDGGGVDDVAAAALAAEAAVATDGDYAAAIEANYERAQAFLDLEGRLEAAAAPPRAGAADEAAAARALAAPPAPADDCYAAWEADGYVCLPGVVPPALCAAAAAAIREFVRADDADEATWYANTGDIYDESLAPRLAHGPCGMVQMSHHASLWAIRQCPGVHRAFADVYGTEELWVTCDRAHFKPPERADHPAWADPGDVHRGMHWDVDVGRPPVPFSVQGVVYLEATDASTGALRVVPGCRGRLASLREAWRSTGADAHAGEAVAAEGPAHARALARRDAPRPGPQRRREAARVGLRRHAPRRRRALRRPAAAELPAEPQRRWHAVHADPDSATRLDRGARAAKWRGRAPLLVEDPAEADLDRRPRARPTAPFPAHGAGRKLAGLGGTAAPNS